MLMAHIVRSDPQVKESRFILAPVCSYFGGNFFKFFNRAAKHT
tara:strand:+ start:62604 stop:62732 length:129 start_codon:yes stop_codon:yes gene_type:complete